MSLSGEAVLYAASPSDKIAQESARRERRRRKVYKELFETEKKYLHHLDLVNKFFDFPLRFAYIVPDDVHAKLFSNLEQIREVNLTLLEQMEQTTVGQAFIYLGPFLKLYSTYANNHQSALNTLQEWQSKSQAFAKFLSRQEDRPEVMGLKLNALLITPIQRIPRYKLLLEELLNHTLAEHHDYQKLKEATVKIAEIASHINEHVRQNENFMKMLAIQKMFDNSAPKLLTPGRQFIKEGPLKKQSRKGGKSFERMFFLFSDILLYGKPKFLDGGGKSYTCSCVLPLRHCTVTPNFTNNASQSDTGGMFQITCKEESLVLYSEDKSNAKEWSQEMDRAIRKICDDRQTLRKPSSNNIPLRGRSLRKHRQQQKKTDIKFPGKTPMRPLSVVSNTSYEGTDLDSSSDFLARLEPVRQHFKMVRDMSLFHTDTGLQDSTQDSPVLRKKQSFDENASSEDLGVSLPDYSGSCADSGSYCDSLRSSYSQDSFDSIFQSRTGVQKGELRKRQSLRQYSSSLRGSTTYNDENGQERQVLRERCIPGSKETHVPHSNYGPSQTGGSRLPSPRSRPQDLKTSEEATVWFPPNSIAHKYQAPRKTLNEKLSSCLRNPLKRFHKAKKGGTDSASTMKQKGTFYKQK